ncbi:FAD-dependent oxidoreductase [Thermodesulfatator atlanticus]|uniref:FAD-dependent oxidoreductase n=1 Tax=Thermodesulfatator atlanticus TaxID=501497 RepID=UPI0003B504B2|nr:FAD-dependent oxidoreductase [Thermodesulfatator atlanticus]
MKDWDIIVLGGGPAGITAATTARRHYPDKKILLVRKLEKSLVPCGIPYMFGLLKDPTRNINPDGVLQSRGIELVIDEAVNIDCKERRLSLRSGKELSYKRLIWATGSEPFVPPIPGRELENVFVINKDFSYLLKILKALQDAKHVVVVGGGFIGVEFAEQIRIHHKLEVSVVEMLPYCLYSYFDEEFCFEAERELQQMGINLYTASKVAEFKGVDGKVREVHLADGKVLPADVVLISTGTIPEAKLAKEAGLAIKPDGSLDVDRTMRTSDPYIYACGDCTEKFSFFSGRPVPVRLASVAAMEARIAGANLYARRRINPGTIGVFSTKIGEKVFAAAGLIERVAEAEGFDVLVGDASAPNRHPSVLPGAKDMHVKLVFDGYTGVLLGGQIVGGESAAELVNLLSACLLHRMTAVEISAFQMGTHPLLTPSPAGYPLAVAAELAAVEKLKNIPGEEY